MKLDTIEPGLFHREKTVHDRRSRDLHHREVHRLSKLPGVKPDVHQKRLFGMVAHVTLGELNRGAGDAFAGRRQPRVIFIGINLVRLLDRLGASPSGAIAKDGPGLIKSIRGHRRRVGAVDGLAGEDACAAAAEVPFAEVRGAIARLLQARGSDGALGSSQTGMPRRALSSSHTNGA